MSAIGHGHLKCFCGKVRPYWSEFCKSHRKSNVVESCEMTMGDNGKNLVDGREHYWKCGKPAKFIIQRKPTDRQMLVCGLHAASERKICERFGFQLPKKIVCDEKLSQ
jgi:hypothetical protein